MPFNYTTIKLNPDSELIRLALLVDENLTKMEDPIYSVHRCYPLRDFQEPAIRYFVSASYSGGKYESLIFTVVVRELITVHPRVVTKHMRSIYGANVLLVNRFELQEEIKTINELFLKENIKVVWWSDLSE
jgi:hypothetical protein